MLKELDIRVSPRINNDIDLLKSEIIIHLKKNDITINRDSWDFRVLKRSIDARPKLPVYQLKILVAINEELPEKQIYIPKNQQVNSSISVVIIGAGPAGLFAALELLELGIKPIIVERGKNVQERRRDLALINKEHLVNSESNYCFGEGGAGTYSDGKLYTRSNKRGDVNKVLQQLVAFGATETILVDAHPHIGTNKLPKIIESIREHIINSGGEVHFNTKLTGLNVRKGKIYSAVVNQDEEIIADDFILATGHSARDIFQLLHQQNILIENKPFALGVRVEHPQSLIDAAQYRSEKRDENLPPASYTLVSQTGEKAVYSFCMCPGGIIAPCATSPGEIVTNGWSPSKRNNPYANSGIVVPVDESDWLAYKSFGPLAALEFQSAIEKSAYNTVQKLGGLKQTAPAQGLKDFIDGKHSDSLARSSYQPGTMPTDLSAILPSKLSRALKLGFKDFGSKIKNFISNDAVVHGVESRTSSPVKIPRDISNLQHPEINNLYPSGEGAGYAGGIMSAAIDGQKCANAIAIKHQL